MGHGADSTSSCSRGPRVVISKQNIADALQTCHPHTSPHSPDANGPPAAALVEVKKAAIFSNI